MHGGRTAVVKVGTSGWEALPKCRPPAAGPLGQAIRGRLMSEANELSPDQLPYFSQMALRISLSNSSSRSRFAGNNQSREMLDLSDISAVMSADADRGNGCRGVRANGRPNPGARDLHASFARRVHHLVG
jgi:hypothetical protein